MSFFKRIALSLFRRLHGVYWRLAEQDLPRFANAPQRLRIELPRRLSGPDYMHFGDDVNIGPGALIVAQTRYPTSVMQHPQQPRPLQEFSPSIKIGRRVTSTGALTISALESVTIEDDVMLASNVFISDGMHGISRVDEPYKYQPLERIAPVTIQRGCWIGQNVVIMPGVTIGEMTVVGANCVVTHSMPPRSIVVGAPARVVKRWDDTRGWVKVSSEKVLVVDTLDDQMLRKKLLEEIDVWNLRDYR
jgi:serine acetyltransferase